MPMIEQTEYEPMDTDGRRRAALAASLLGLELVAKGVARREDVAVILDHIRERYGFTSERV
jgi:hypothetical protein